MGMTADAPAAVAEAEALYASGAYAEAAELLAPLALPQQQDARIFRLLGLARLRLGVVTESVAALEQAVRRNPDDPALALDCGIALQTAGRTREAAAKYQFASQRLPREAAPLLNWAQAKIALGEIAGAVRLARKGAQMAAALPQAHYILGQALAAAGQWAEARDAFRRTTELDPRFADGWINAGITEYRLGQIDAAKAAMRAALGVDPRNLAAAGNLAVLLRLTGGLHEAEQMLAAVARAPQAIDARLTIAGWWLEEDRFQDALALLQAESPAGPAPGNPALARAWRMQHALALTGTGQTARARAELSAIGSPPPPEAALLNVRRLLLAQAERDLPAARRHAKAAEDDLRRFGKDMLPENRIMTHFDLAKFWSGLNEPKRAFAFWVNGHALLRRFQPFSRDRFRGFVEASIAAFSRARLTAGALAGNRDAAPVFVVGLPRSGTTLVEQILGAHPAAHAAGERSALGRMFWALGCGEDAAAAARVGALDTAALDAAASHYLAELHAVAPAAERIVDKMPGNALYLGLVAMLLPGARIIHCVRDPRDTGFSIFTYRFYGEHPYAHDLGDLGWYMGEHARLMAHWQAALPAPPLRLPLLDWVADFRGTLARVLAHVGLPYDAACERFHQREDNVRTVSRAQVREPVNARGLGRWKPYAAHLAPMIAALPEVPALSDDEVLASLRAPPRPGG